MNTTRKRRWKRALWFAALAALAVVLALCAVVWTGLADRWGRRAIVGQLEKMTGGRVELGRFHFEPLRLRATLGNLTIHGQEPEEIGRAHV